MTQNGNGFSSFAKGLFVGGLVGAAVALLYAPRRRTRLLSDIPQESVGSQGWYRPLPAPRVEKIVATGKLDKPSIGWLVMFYVASAVAMISDLRIKMKKV